MALRAGLQHHFNRIEMDDFIFFGCATIEKCVSENFSMANGHETEKSHLNHTKWHCRGRAVIHYIRLKHFTSIW